MKSLLLVGAGGFAGAVARVAAGRLGGAAAACREGRVLPAAANVLLQVTLGLAAVGAGDRLFHEL